MDLKDGCANEDLWQFRQYPDPFSLLRCRIPGCPAGSRLLVRQFSDCLADFLRLLHRLPDRPIDFQLLLRHCPACLTDFPNFLHHFPALPANFRLLLRRFPAYLTDFRPLFLPFSHLPTDFRPLLLPSHSILTVLPPLPYSRLLHQSADCLADFPVPPYPVPVRRPAPDLTHSGSPEHQSFPRHFPSLPVLYVPVPGFQGCSEALPDPFSPLPGADSGIPAPLPALLSSLHTFLKLEAPFHRKPPSHPAVHCLLPGQT